MRVIRIPETIEVPIRPTIMGIISRPDAAAEVPDDICRNVGTNPIAANMPSPRVRPIAVAFTNTGLRNRLSGMIGSSALASAMMKPVTAASSPTPHAHVAGELQPKSLSPPKSVKKIRHVVAADRKITPRMSIRFVAFLLGSVRANSAITNAAMPTGMLM